METLFEKLEHRFSNPKTPVSPPFVKVETTTISMIHSILNFEF
jgi:hypothetical protein